MAVRFFVYPFEAEDSDRSSNVETPTDRGVPREMIGGKQGLSRGCSATGRQDSWRRSLA